MEFRWIQISLFLTALLHFTAAATHGTVRVGDDVTLFCENLIRNQPGCSYTTWLITDPTNSASVELVTHGQIGVNAGTKSDRLRVTEDCSLIIKKVKEEDAGLYTCQQFSAVEQRRPDSFSVVDLPVVNMTEIKNPDDTVTLRCFVRTYEPCRLTVKWVYEGKDVEKQHQNVRTTPGLCFAEVTAPTYHLIYKPGHNSLQCEVSEGDNKQLFPFRLQPSDEDNNHAKPTQQPSKTSTKTPEQPTTAPRPTGNRETNKTPPTPTTQTATVGKGLLWLYVTVPVVLLTALLILVVVFIRRKKTKGTETQRNDDVLSLQKDPEDGVSYASIKFTKKNKTKVKTQGKADDGDAEDGVVTYATVKSASSSSPVDPKSLYATINKERK